MARPSDRTLSPSATAPVVAALLGNDPSRVLGPETVREPMEPIEVGGPEFGGNACWLWHPLWDCGPQIGFWDREAQWWKITTGALDDDGLVEKAGAWGVGIPPSHWSTLTHPPLVHHVFGWGAVESGSDAMLAERSKA